MLMMMSIVFSGCAKTDKAGETGDSFTPVVFIDSTGEQITIKSKPVKVAVLFSSYAEIWNLAGGETAITVGDSISRGFVKEDTVSLVDDGSGIEINQELLVSFSPDLVIGSADMDAQVKACEFCRSIGIPSALFRVETVDDYLSMLKVCTDITGDKAAYERYGIKVADEVNDIKQNVSNYIDGKEPVKILFIRAGSAARSTKAKTADDNFAAKIFKELGTYNIAENAPVLLDGLSLEEILKENPEYIFISTQGNENAAKQYIQELFAGDGWKELEAVKKSNYVFLPKDLFHYKPNAKWAEAYQYAVDILYPELKSND